MPMVKLILVLLVVAYVLYVFLAESLNPFRTPYEERGQFLHRCGWLAGAVLLLSPLSLRPFPVAGLWPQIQQCLLVAFLLLAALTLLYALWVLAGIIKQRSHEAKVNSALTKDEALALRAAMALPDEVEEAILKQQSININADRAAEPDTTARRADGLTDGLTDGLADELAIELAMADQEIKLSELTAEESRLLDKNLVVLEPTPDLDLKSVQAKDYVSKDSATDAVISDAIIIEAPISIHEETATDGRPDHPVATHSALGIMRMQSNSQQIELVDSFTGAVDGAHQLNNVIARVSSLSSDGRSLNSRINAEAQRKLIQTTARVDKTGKALKHEQAVRQALESRLSRQVSELEKSKQQMAILKKTLTLRQQQLDNNAASLGKARDMARSAAKLARRAAVSQQRARSVAQREKVLRQKVEARTQQAINIAKNAITALAAEEKKKRFDTIN